MKITVKKGDTVIIYEEPKNKIDTPEILRLKIMGEIVSHVLVLSQADKLV